jgi:hypothetical protein
VTVDNDNGFPLYPHEKLLWVGRPAAGAPRDLRWTLVPLLLLSLAAIAAMFAGLAAVSGLPAVKPSALVAAYLTIVALGFRLVPHYSLDPCVFAISDRRVFWKRGRLTRIIERNAITFARIHWHRVVPGLGTLELVRSVPFGPLSRQQRVVLHDVIAPDILFALICDAESSEFAGYADVRLTDRLDRDERVLWGASPEGYLLGARELTTALLGVMALIGGGIYGYRTGRVLIGLEDLGLSVFSWTWVLLFSAIALTLAIIGATGATLLWHGLWGARAAGRETEYVLTDKRLLIRRGLTELSVDRKRIFDVADVPTFGGAHNLFLILDGPQGRALSDNGALSALPPSRSLVPPVLYEVSEVEPLRHLLFRAPQRNVSKAA